MKLKQKTNQFFHRFIISVVGLVQIGVFFAINTNNLVLAQSISSKAYSRNKCATGWFGDKCEFLCHCSKSRACDRNGFCESGCHPSWFGPACQYLSLPFSSQERYQQAGAQSTGISGKTCYNGETQSVTVKLSEPHPLTWIRLIVDRNAKQLDKLAMAYQIFGSTAGFMNCQHLKRAQVNDTTLDIYCPTSEPISHMMLVGDAVQNLCSLYISGGRNVALKQKTQHSSVYRGWSSANAVDGKDDGNTKSGKTCFQTLPRATDYDFEWWTVDFSDPVDIVTAEIINSRDLLLTDSCCKEKPLGLRFWGYPRVTPDAPKSYVYSDVEPDPVRVFRVVPSPRIPWPARRVMLQLSKQPLNVSFTFCEVAIFGETNCTAGKFGRQCEHTCNCQDQHEACFVSTGACPSGCAPGYTGDNCWTPCPDGKYGHGCRENCSENCYVSNSCSPLNGACTIGCKSGYKEPQCKEEISSTDSLQLWMIFLVVVVFVIIIIAIVAVIVANFVWRRRKGRKSTPIDDTVTAGSSGNENDPKVGTQHQSQNVATPMQIFSTYDVISPSDPEEDAIHTYATDFDPYDKVIESINDKSSSKPLPGVQPVNTSKAEDCVEQGDIDSGLYIQMTDVSSPKTTTEKPYLNLYSYSNIGSTETTQLGGGGDGDYLTPIDVDDTDCVVEAGYVKL